MLSSGRLKALEVENFKSYKGKQFLGPFKQFSAVIGPNGSGKSNLMDAICFVLGEQPKQLRVKKIIDLIHGASIEKPVSKSCRVTLIYEHADGREQTFTRTSTDYRIDGEHVNMNDYHKQLEAIGIMVKAKNFLVPQGTVETIAMKSAKDRTQLFEEISHSGELKEEYDRLKEEMVKADEDTQFNFHKKRGILAERKEAQQEKAEAEKYNQMQLELVERQLQLHLLRLYAIDEQISELKSEVAQKQKDVEKHEAKHQKIEEEYKEKRKEQAKLQKDLVKIEKQLTETDGEYAKKMPGLQKALANSKHSRNKIEQQQKSLAAAKTKANNQAERIANLERDLEAAKEQREEFETEYEEEMRSQGLQLNEDQTKEYKRLKEAAEKAAAVLQQELDAFQREQNMDAGSLDNEKRRKKELSAKIVSKEQELQNTKLRIEKFEDQIKHHTAEAAEKREQLERLQEETASANARLEAVTEKLAENQREMGDAAVDSNESWRQQKKQELVEALKRMFPGVYGRLVDLCQPTHKRYHLAVTKVLGKNMNAIIVDRESVGRECINYMKEQRHEPETFLPLDYLTVKDIPDHLRELREPKGVKLVIDVIQYEKAIKKALVYACQSALVCETAEDARALAYGSGGSQRYKAVSLDGTLFQKSGIISGGASDLKSKARKWDEKEMKKLKVEREKLQEEQKECLALRRRQGEIPYLEQTLRGLDTKVKYLTTDHNSAKNKQTPQFEKELNQFHAEMQHFEPRILEMENKMADREAKLNKIKDKMHKVEDEIFADFCSAIGVSNIRQYEEREVHWQQDKKKQIMEMDENVLRLQGQLDYEQQSNLQETLKTLENGIAKEEADWKRYSAEESKLNKEINVILKRVEELKAERVSKKAELEEFDGEMSEVKKRMQNVQKEAAVVQKAVAALESKIDQKRSDRHTLLQTCKMEDVKLPLARGSMADIGGFDPSQSQDSIGSSQGSAGSSGSFPASRDVYDREAKIKIDYDKLDSAYRRLSGEQAIRKEEEKLAKEVAEKATQLQRVQAPNLKAKEKFEGVKDREKEMTAEFESARRKAQRAKKDFEKVQHKRKKLFQDCFDKVSENIDEIYKALSRNQSAQAVLVAENPEEPYLDGLAYNCVAPGKRFRPMDNLSGGEKTIAALALLFAMHSYQSSPFFVLDEIDAALDNTNIGKVAAFIREQAEQKMQIIVISLKEEFYHRADALVGIYPKGGPCTVSGVLTLDLTEYREPRESQEQ